MGKKTHGLSNSRVYHIYSQMCARCNNPKSTGYKYYGEKGVRVCDEWVEDFLSFYAWSLANGYEETLTIDRKDASLDYEPSNCRWITMHENILNQTRNKNRTIEDRYISEQSADMYIVCVGGSALGKRVVLYRERFLTKKDAILARDLFLEKGEKTRYEKHKLGTSKKDDVSGKLKKKKREQKRLLHKLKYVKKTKPNTNTKIQVGVEIKDALISIRNRDGLASIGVVIDRILAKHGNKSL